MVFGDDGSPAADVAWSWINSHEWADWQLKVVTAVVPDLVFTGEPDGDASSHPTLSPRPSADAAFGSVEQITIDEDPRLALSRPSDLLVIGPRGPGIAKALHLGSTAEWLTTKPPSPMVIARHGRRTQRIVICHDGSDHAQAAVHAVCSLPWVASVAVTIVAVDDGSVDTEGAIDLGSVPLVAAGVNVDRLVLPGDRRDATAALRRYLDHAPADLVALGTRGLTGIKRVVVGSTASAIAHRSEQTVLLACHEVPVD